MHQEKTVIGLVEKVKIFGVKGRAIKEAVFDTGATTTSIDLKLAARVGLGPIVGVKRVKSASNPHGRLRLVAAAIIQVKEKKLHIKANIVDRSGLRYKVLVGRDVIHSNFVIDPSKTHTSYRIEDLHEEGDHL